MKMAARRISVIGAGILGLWQALVLARRGHAVRLIEASADPFAAGASRYAGVMLAPDCEAEAAPPVMQEAGRAGLEHWRKNYPALVNAGTLVVAASRDQPELARLAKSTRHHRTLDQQAVASLEPDLAGRFSSALHFHDEAHMTAPDALTFLLDQARAAGVEARLGETWHEEETSDVVVDCRGMAAQGELPDLRGVRGERLLVRTAEIAFARPVRLLHPRHPLYVVPWSESRFLIGATMIESEDAGPISVRSALELLGMAYALHPAFGEAQILETGAGVRPAFPDNVPRAIVRDGGKRIFVNGTYRHGYLLAPVLAEAVAAYLQSGAGHPLLVRE
jgi:glycine oxidase